MSPESLPPGLILILGAALTPLLNGRARAAWMLALPVLGFYHLTQLTDGAHITYGLFGQSMVHLRVDGLSLVFGYVFYIAAFLAVIYALHVRKALENSAALAYAGAAIGAIFAGDLVTLFIYWELTAISSVFLILARGTQRSFGAAMRYLVIQVGSGVILLSGLIVHYQATGSIAFNALDPNTLGGGLILLSFAIKAAFPLLHNWLQDAYPEATVSGTVFLSSFTTKLAIYALARGFAGTEWLVYVGAAMTAFPIFYAVLENDLRKVLSYSLNNQLGFMVVGVGIGTELAINGAAAHAFCHILYKSLLFMSMGAVLYRVGTVKGSELGGLYKSMPITTVLCIIGGMSISAFPLFSGFVSKSMILLAAADEGFTIPFLVLLFASAGVMHHSGIKVPYFAFFAHDSGKRCQEAPMHMLIAMGLAALLCVGIGVYPAALYQVLPYPVDFEPYTTSHVVLQLQLLLFSGLAFGILMRTGIYPPELKSTNLDTDWVYRRALPALWRGSAESVGQSWALLVGGLHRMVRHVIYLVSHHHGPEGVMARTWPTGSMVLSAVVLLAAYLILFYLLPFLDA